MKIKSLIAILFLITTKAVAQKSEYAIEINPYMRYDKYKEFFSFHNDYFGNHYVTPKGTSFGLNLNVKKQIKPVSTIYLGLGYYKLTISNIKYTTQRGVGNARIINFPSPLFIFFFSDKYAYQTVSLNAGYERYFKLKKNYLITTGIDLNGLYTYSQYYHLTRNPDGGVDYRKKNETFFGILAGFDIGLMKSFKQLNIGPKIKLPVLASLKTDDTFANEDGADHRNTWFSGVGLGVSFNYKLNK